MWSKSTATVSPPVITSGWSIILGPRHRLNFPDFEGAKSEAAAKVAQLARGDVDAVQLTGKDRLAYGRALDAIKDFGIPLDAAAIDYAEARKVLSGFSLTEAARFFMRHHGRGVTSKLVAEAVEAFRTGKQTEGRSRLYLDDLRYRLDDFANAFNVEVRQLTPADVRDFMSGLRFGARSFNNHRRALQTFFRFCQAHGWLSKESDLLERVGRRKESAPDIEVFTAGEVRKLLNTATSKAATCVAIQAFAGVRSEELLRLTWADVERRKGFIEISAGQAKTAQRRLIPVSDNLAGWRRMLHETAMRFGHIQSHSFSKRCAMRRRRRKSDGRPTACDIRSSPFGWRQQRM